MTTKLTIKTYLQLMSLKKKSIRSKHYLQVISFHSLLFIWIKKNSIQFKKCNNNNNKVAGCVMYREQATSWTNENEML